MMQPSFTGILSGVAIAAAIWMLGSFRRSPLYRRLRGWLGTASFRCGHFVSLWGNASIKGLWEPFEAVFVDFFLFMAEQFAVGLRRDNPPKVREQIRRLEDVGSTRRLEALRRSPEEEP